MQHPAETRDPSDATASDDRAGGGPASQPRRLPYERPELRVIELVAEEVLSVGCKLSTGPGGPIGATCTAASCFAEGS